MQQQELAAENYKVECFKQISVQKENSEFKDITNIIDTCQVTEKLDETQTLSAFKIPDFDTMMFLPANMKS